MKTLKQVIEENPEYAKLIRAVIRNLGKDYIMDVVRNGADAGYPGFTYYRDTVAFFKRHKKDILALARQQSEELGEDVLSMIANFNCLSIGRYPDRKPEYSQTEIGEAIFGSNYTDHVRIQNAMAWYALEEVCRKFED